MLNGIKNCDISILTDLISSRNPIITVRVLSLKKSQKLNRNPVLALSAELHFKMFKNSGSGCNDSVNLAQWNVQASRTGNAVLNLGQNTVATFQKNFCHVGEFF